MTTACPSPEVLVAYTTGVLPDPDRTDAERHLHACAHCVRVVQKAAARLSVAADVGMPVPAMALARVRPVAVVGEDAAALRAHPAPPVPAALIDKVRALFGARREGWSMRLLIPAAMAVAAVLVIGGPLRYRPSPGLERGVGGEGQMLRVTAPQAPLRAGPGSREAARKTVPRGTAVTVVSQRGDWYKVRLSDGTEGWMEQEHFD